MPEFRFLGVKTDYKKLFSSLVVLVATINYLLTQLMLMFFGWFALFSMPLAGLITIACTVCALNIPRIEMPWHETRWNWVRITAAIWTATSAICAMAILPAFAVRGSVGIPMLLASFVYVVFPRKPKPKT